MRRVFRGIIRLWYFFIANTLGRILYSNKYIKGRYFKGIKSDGWKWIARGILFQKVLGNNRDVPWPVSERVYVGNYKNIKFNINDLHIFQVFGNYYQAWNNGKIEIGEGSYIAPNVGIITSNHDVYNLEHRQQSKNIILGRCNWIGMNSVILPGVKLGDHTIVGAGSVVTKSFQEGYCVIAGNPARKIRDLDKEEFNKNEN